MQIRLRNEIKIDHQLEIVNQVFPATFVNKKGYCYLTFTNENSERVILKVNDDSLVMTRFSNPKSVMQFLKSADATVQIPTAVGWQNLLSRTSVFQLNLKKQELTLAYQLLAPETETVFADYHLSISWK